MLFMPLQSFFYSECNKGLILLRSFRLCLDKAKYMIPRFLDWLRSSLLDSFLILVCTALIVLLWYFLWR